MALAPPPRGTAPTPQPTNYGAYPPKLPPDFDVIAQRGGYHVEPDGRVYTLTNGTKSYIPPWVVWQNSSAGRTADGLGLTDEGRAYRTAGSDPSSAWHWMFENSGPFTHQSQWDDSKGTYKGSVDWLTLLGTIGAGAVIGGGLAAVAGGGGGGGAGTVPALEGTAAGPGAATTTAGLGTAPIAAETGATTGGLSGATLPGATTIPTVADLAGTGSAVAGTNLAGGLPAATGASPFSSLLSTLTSPAVLGTIAQGAFGLYAASQAAGASTDAAKIIADANTAAAKLYSDSQLEAAKIQAQSTQNALDFAKEGYAGEVARYNQNQEQLAPYTGAGDAAVTKLSQLLGLGTPPPYHAPVIPPITSTPAPATASPQPSQATPASTGGSSSPTIDAGTGRGVTTQPISQPPPVAPAGSIASLSMPLAPQQNGQAMVTLRAPTGEVTQKPATELQHWLSLGAQQVPGSSVQMGGVA